MSDIFTELCNGLYICLFKECVSLSKSSNMILPESQN